MNLYLISCQVLYREICQAAAKSPNTTRTIWMPQGLHVIPSTIKANVENTMEQLYQDIENHVIRQKPDAIVLGYGLCSNGVLGIQARDIPIVVPRTDDCIALFLGSQKRYLELFHQKSGSYWVNRAWMEFADVPTEENYKWKRQEYIQQYGEDNADYLMDFESSWIQNYHYCGYIKSDIYEEEIHQQAARRMAELRHWEYFDIQGDSRMIQNLVNGIWDQEDFLVCPPWHRVEADYTGLKVKAVPIRQES